MPRTKTRLRKRSKKEERKRYKKESGRKHIRRREGRRAIKALIKYSFKQANDNSPINLHNVNTPKFN